MDIWQNKKKPKTEAAKDILIQCLPVHLQFSLLLSPWQCLWILSSQEIQVFLPQAQGSVWPASAIHHPLIIYISWQIPHDVLKNVSVMVWRRACAVSDLYIIWSITSSLCTIHVYRVCSSIIIVCVTLYAHIFYGYQLVQIFSPYSNFQCPQVPLTEPLHCSTPLSLLLYLGQKSQHTIINNYISYHKIKRQWYFLHHKETGNWKTKKIPNDKSIMAF